MLALTKKTDYALIAVACMAKRASLANQNGTAKQEAAVMSAREIACLTSVPQPILTNILKTLTSTGIINSVRGASGGYAMARPVADISLRELIVAIEGPIQFVQCALQPPESTKDPCDLEAQCPVRGPAIKVHDRLDSFLEQVSLAEIVGENAAPRERHTIQLELVPGKVDTVTELTL